MVLLWRESPLLFDLLFLDGQANIDFCHCSITHRMMYEIVSLDGDVIPKLCTVRKVPSYLIPL
jgi:hypothetical protein